MAASCFRTFTAMKEGSNTDHLFRFHTILKCGVLIVDGTHIWRNVFAHLLFVNFLFLTAPFLCCHEPYIFYWYCFRSSQHIFRFLCNTCSFVIFGTSFGVAGGNINLLYSGMTSGSSATRVQFDSLVLNSTGLNLIDLNLTWLGWIYQN